jgi:glycogen synthase
VPSIYEPFGMVALEGAAAGAPLAVAATGGLAEIVQPGVTGMTFPAKDPDALAHAVDALLADAEQARTMAQRARHLVHETYNWRAIARRTVAVYDAALADVGALTEARTEAILAPQTRSIEIPHGNLLTGAAA